MEGGRRSPVEDGGVADEHKPLFASLHPLLKGGIPGGSRPLNPPPNSDDCVRHFKEEKNISINMYKYSLLT